MAKISKEVAREVMEAVMNGSLSPKIKKPYYNHQFSLLMVTPTIPIEVSVFADKSILDIIISDDLTIHVELNNAMVKELVNDLSKN